MNYKIQNIKEVDDIELLWRAVVDGTSYAWFWSTYYEHCFRISVLKANGKFIQDKSFLIYDNKNLCGLVPLVFVNSSDFDGIDASYDKPLPWPMIMDSVQDKISLIEFVFNKIDKIAYDNNVQKISLQYSPPGLENTFGEIFSTIVKNNKYIDNSFKSHYISISSSVLSHVRKRYKRYVKKYSDLYKLNIVDKNNFYINISKEYMKLHIKDSGAFLRPLETYVEQFNWVVKGDGFVVQAINIQTNKIVGMLIICMSKKAAYDASVAVDPDFQQDYVSHLMKWNAIQHLIDNGVSYYELGEVAENSGYLRLPSKKNYGISFFKDGWSRGKNKKTLIYDKYFSKSALSKVWDKKLSELIEYYDI